MGRFSKTVQIKGSADKVKDRFCEVMKKRGFVPCQEDEAALSYLLAFGGGWATLASENYRDDPKQADEDARQLAEEINTSCFSVEIVDSDFAILKLFGVGHSDEVIVGDGSGYGIEDAPKGDRGCWEPLLVEGCTWEQFSDAWENDEVFVEDALSKMAAFLGIDPYYICADFDDVLEKADDRNITAFYFKKAAAKSKSMSLNAAFVKVFGDALEPLGFKKIKSRYPYFVRVVTDEIIHVISYYNDKQCYDQGHNYIMIQGGVATVYRQEIDLTRNPKYENWLTGNCNIYLHRLELDLEKPDDELKERLYPTPSSPDEPLKAMESELELTKRFILPALDKAVTINSCIENSFEVGMRLYLVDDGSFGATHYRNYDSEGMLYFKTDKSVFEGIMKNAVSKFALQEKSFFEKVHSDPELFNKAQTELERRKAENIETLKSYGIDMPDTK